MANNSVSPCSPEVSLDAGQMNLIRLHLRKLTAYTDILDKAAVAAGVEP